MRPMPPISRNLQRNAVLIGLVLFQVRLAPGQRADQLSPPPDFSQRAIAKSAEDLANTWTKWMRAGRGLDHRVFRLPMLEAREALQRGLSEFLDLLDKRRAYSESVVAYLERNRVEPHPEQPAVTLSAVYQDHIYQLGLSLTALQEKLDALREYPEWLAVRRSVQPEADRAFKLQSSRRSEMPISLSLKDARPAASVSILVYRDAERQVIDQFGRLWTGYYEALLGAVEQKPGGSAPLNPIRASAAESKPAAPGRVAENPLAGVWVYQEGSQQFNGVAEPRQVLLELWMEGGLLMGRYRAELPTFQGIGKVDLRLHGALAAGNPAQELDFESKDPAAAGQIVIEGPGTSGLELMVLRVVSTQSPIPPGRELLRRR